MHPLTRAHHPFSSLDVVMMFEHVPMAQPPQWASPRRRPCPPHDESLRLAAGLRCARAKMLRDVRCLSTRPEEPRSEPALVWVLLRTLVRSAQPNHGRASPEATERGAPVANEGALAEVLCLGGRSSRREPERVEGIRHHARVA